MIIMENTSQIRELRDEHPDEILCYEEPDGTRKLYMPGRDGRPVTIPPNHYTPKYTP